MSPEPELEILHEGPVVVSVVADTLTGSALGDELLRRYPDQRFVVIGAVDRPAARRLLIGLGSVAAEMVFTASGDREVAQAMAMWALEELGFGQDFVFTVPDLAGAVESVAQRLAQPRRDGWEGDSILLLVPGAGQAAARDAVRSALG